MAPKVFFSPLSSPSGQSPLAKFTQLLESLDVATQLTPRSLVAVKVHFGELGNTAFIRPIYLRPILGYLRAIPVKPFLTDTNTLYMGMRGNSVDHLHNATLNGFNYSTLQTPVIIADGLRGEYSLPLPLPHSDGETAKLGGELLHADALLVVSHFKGHEVAGFGGALKNLSMGCASRAGKLAMHSRTRPQVKVEKCTACGRCSAACGSSAIEITAAAEITSRCTGCARCIAVCPERAIGIDWNASTEYTQRKMVEYAQAVHTFFTPRVAYINILTQISPGCDCYPGNDAPMAPDIGFLASHDPVALDLASYRLMTEAARDPQLIKKVYDYLDPEGQFVFAKEFTFGSLEYELVKLS